MLQGRMAWRAWASMRLDDMFVFRVIMQVGWVITLPFHPYHRQSALAACGVRREGRGNAARRVRDHAVVSCREKTSKGKKAESSSVAFFLHRPPNPPIPKAGEGGWMDEGAP